MHVCNIFGRIQGSHVLITSSSTQSTRPSFYSFFSKAKTHEIWSALPSKRNDSIFNFVGDPNLPFSFLLQPTRCAAQSLSLSFFGILFLYLSFLDAQKSRKLCGRIFPNKIVVTQNCRPIKFSSVLVMYTFQSKSVLVQCLSILSPRKTWGTSMGSTLLLVVL